MIYEVINKILTSNLTSSNYTEKNSINFTYLVTVLKKNLFSTKVPNCQVLMTYRTRCLIKSDLPVYMTVALAHIRFISDLFPHKNEA